MHYFLLNFSLVQTGGSNTNGTFGAGPRLTGLKYGISNLVSSFGILGLLICSLAILFMVVDIIKNKRDLNYSNFVIIYLIFILVSIGMPIFIIADSTGRYFFQAFAIIPVLMGVFFVITLEKIKNVHRSSRKQWRFYRTSMLIFITVFLIANNGIVVSITRSRDSITATRDWISSNLPANAKYCLDAYTEVPSNFKNVNFLLNNQLDVHLIKSFTYDYLVISGNQYYRWALIYPNQFENQSNFYFALFNGSTQYVLIKEFVRTIPDVFDLLNSTSTLTLGFDETLDLLTQPGSLWGGDVFIFKLTSHP